MMNADLKAPQSRSVLKVAAAAAPILLALILVTSFVGTYQLPLLT